MWNDYAREKLRQIEHDLASAKMARLNLPLPKVPPEEPAREQRMLAPVARAAGRRARRIGEALESWAAASEPARSRSWREGGRS